MTNICAKPLFIDDNNCVVKIKRGEIIFLAVTDKDTEVLQTLELLESVKNIARDLCGDLDVRTLFDNHVMLMEILREVVSERVSGETNLFEELSTLAFTGKTKETKNEVFLDLIEKLKATINQDGIPVRLAVKGEMRLRSELPAGNVIEIKMADNIHIGNSQAAYGDTVHLTSLRLGSSVDEEKFNQSRILKVPASAATETVLSYSLAEGAGCSGGIPFRVVTQLRPAATSERDLEIEVRLLNDIPARCLAQDITLIVPLIGQVKCVTYQLAAPNHSFKYDATTHCAKWSIEKLYGLSQTSITFQAIEGQRFGKRLLGPIALQFELSGHVTSGLRVLALNVTASGNAPPAVNKWVRYITISDSYVTKTQNSAVT